MKIKEYLPLYKTNLLLAGPVVLSQIGQVTVSLADNMMVGHVGTPELAAASFASSVFHIGMLFGIGICIGLTPLVGRAFSQKKDDEAGAYLKNGFFVHLVMSILIVFIMGGVSFFLNRMGQPVEVAKMALPYFLQLVVSLFPMLIFFSFTQFLEGVGNTKIAMYITLSSNLINIGLNYLLIFGKFGFPELGLLGAGWATLISRVCMPIMLIPVLMKNKSYRHLFAIAYHARFLKSKMREVLNVGIPIGFQVIVEITTFAVGAIMMGWIGAEALAGHQVALGLASMTYMISLGISSGTTIRVSHEYGVKNFQMLKRSVYASLHLVLLFMAIMGIVFVVFRHQLPLLFTTDVDVINVAANLLVIAALFQIFDGVQVILLGTLRGLSDVTIPMFMAFLSYSVVGLPVSYIASIVLGMGPIGVWIGFLCGLSVAAVLFSIRLKRIYKTFA